MNVNKIATILIAMVAMTGLAMAGSTTATYVGSGDYNADWNGRDGEVTIHTYTPEGYDYLHTEADCRFGGYQNMDSSSGWTELDRHVYARNDASTVTYTVDNSGDTVYASVSSDGWTDMYQHVSIADDQTFGPYTGDAIFAHTELDAGRNSVVFVETTAGDTITLAVLDSDRCAWLNSYAIAATDSAVGSASGQVFWMGTYGNGAEDLGYVMVTGSDEIGFDVYTSYDIYGHRHHYTDFDTEGTLYGTDLNPAFMGIDTEFDHGYHADGYIYAIDLN